MCINITCILIVSNPMNCSCLLLPTSDLSMSGMCCLLTVATGMLTYTNANAITYGGYLNLVKRQFQLSGAFLKSRVQSGPLIVVTAILACLTLIYAILGAVSPEFAYFEVDEDDDNHKPIKKLQGFMERYDKILREEDNL